MCPAQSRTSFRLCRRLIAVDGTFLKARFILTLLLAVGIDANGRNILLAWGVVESENRDSWEWFLRHLRRAIPEISSEACTLVSDRDKGLVEAEVVLGSQVTRACCCHHLKENFTVKFGRSLGPLFWQAARARTTSSFEAALGKIGEVKKDAETYLRNSDPQLWAEAHFPGRRYGHDTSNIVESLNNTLKLDRELNIIDLLDNIWHRVMEQRSERLAEAQKCIEAGAQYTPFVTTVVQEGRKWAQSNRVSCSFNAYTILITVHRFNSLLQLKDGWCSRIILSILSTSKQGHAPADGTRPMAFLAGMPWPVYLHKGSRLSLSFRQRCLRQHGQRRILLHSHQSIFQS